MTTFLPLKGICWQRRLTISLCVCASLVGAQALVAGDADKVTSAPEDQQYQNWVDFSLGGLILHGDHGQASQQLRTSDNVFGGIDDLHMEQTVGKSAVLKIDGHAIFGNDDYMAKIDLSQADVGYFRAGYSQYRTWYDGNGGFFPFPTASGGQFFSPDNNVDDLDRGTIFAEFGLRMPDLPEITLRYERDYRYGQKDSTIWGDTNLTDLVGTNKDRKIVPAFRNINETRNIYSLDGLYTIDPLHTDLLLGIRIEHDNNNDSLNYELNPNEKSQRFVTQEDTLSGDMFTGHVGTETRFNEKVWFTTAYSYTTFNTNIGGTRVFGPGFDTTFDPTNPLFANSQVRDHGFYDLLGGSELGQHVANMSLMWMPTDHLSLIAAARFENEENTNVASFTDTNVTSVTVKKKTTLVEQFTPFLENSTDDTTKVAESFEARYTGLADWVFYTRGEWTEEQGTVTDQVRNAGTNEITDSADIDRDRLLQKYTVGTNWYPCQRASISLQYYHKIDDNSYSFPSGPSGGYPGWLTAQDFNTDDVNVRLTLHLLNNLSLVSRYDFQQVTIDTQAFELDKVQSGQTTQNIFTEALTWTPLDRLYLQTSFSYCLNKTVTPATITVPDPTVAKNAPLIGPENLNFKNNYWTISASAGYALGDKTNIQADYTYYEADDYENDAIFTQPYGASIREHTVSVNLTRQIRKNVAANVKYGYFTYNDLTSGGHDNYSGSLVMAGMQVRF